MTTIKQENNHMLSVCIITKNEEHNILEEEEPQLHVVWNETLGEIHVQLMGEVQLEVLRSLLAERFGLNVEFGPGGILYKETITEPM